MVYIPDNPVVWALIFLLGAAIGSFLNVVIYRWPQRESVVHPPSHCMSCGARLTGIDLIPVLSYVLLRGRCRHCHHGYSPRYALVEAAVGGLLVTLLGTQTLCWYSVGLFVVCCCLVVVFFIDLDHMIIPDELVVVIAVVGLAANASGLWHHGPAGAGPAGVTYALQFTQMLGAGAKSVWLPSSLVGLALGGAVFLGVSWFFGRFYGRPVLGMGDVKLAAGMGALLGPGYLFIAWFVLSVVLGAVVGVSLLALGIRKRGDYIPFGPMLAAGGVVLVVFPEIGARIVGLYGG
jgi:leader peptidase (prepilin peptidase) / N-methyltransferase